MGVVLGTDGEKMSKSNNNTIPLFGSRDEITKRVLGIVTDSSDGRPENVYAIHRLFKSEDELKELYAENEGKYKVLKEVLIEDIEAFVTPMRERREKITDDDVREVLKEGGDSARTIAEDKMIEVRKKIGVTL